MRSALRSPYTLSVAFILILAAALPVLPQVSQSGGTSTFGFSFLLPTGYIGTFTDADSLLVGGVKVPQAMVACAQIPNQATEALASHSIWIADNAYQVTGARVVWDTASASGTVTIEKLTTTAAPGSGTAMLTGAISTAGTANTVTTGTLTGTGSTLQLASGNRIGLVTGGDQTSLTGLRVCTSLKRI